jgi:hypothetical protein
VIQTLHAASPVDLDEHYVDSPGTLERVMREEVVMSRADNATALGARDRLLWRNHGPGSTSADLGEDKLTSVVGHQIDLSVGAPVVSGHDAIALLREVLRRELFAGGASGPRR